MEMTDISARFDLGWHGFSLDVNLVLPGHGVSCLFGESGSGKTTVLRCLAGLIHAPGGEMVFKGEVWQRQRHWVPTHRRSIGYVFQEANLFPHLTAIGNLRYGMRRSEAASEASLSAAVDLLGISHLLDRRPATLSGGERQRVAIARALASAPRLLLMDEPLAALDAARKTEILPYLERLHRELALPIVYVTHALDEVARLADHLVLLHQGRVQAQGPVAELMARADLPLGQQDEAGVLIDAEVAEHDRAYGLTRIAFAGTGLWVGELVQAPGQRVRARVLARDVSVSRSAPQQSSVLNALPVTLHSLHPRDRKSTRLNSSHRLTSRMPSSA
jgi:molybdate transport system ATP-binding protein